MTILIVNDAYRVDAIVMAADILEKEDPLRTTLRISQDDSHPNAAGHKFMADFLYDKYKEIYNEH